jgi:uncharacterized membrane protein YfcA
MELLSIPGLLVLGMAVGVVVGLMGVGGGIVLVPALVMLGGMAQHTAQGTSLLLQLPPIGIGALLIYQRKGNVDLRAGIVCAAGFLAGGYFGSYVAIRQISAQDLRGLFGVFLMVAALLLFRQAQASAPPAQEPRS